MKRVLDLQIVLKLVAMEMQGMEKTGHAPVCHSFFQGTKHCKHFGLRQKKNVLDK